MFFEINDKTLASRIGKIYTKSGFIETPALLPVVKVDYDPELLSYIKKIGFRAIITNAYLFWKKFRGKVMDLHDYFNFKGVIMTDSGGYQVLKYGDVEITPKTALLYQFKIKSDIGVILDYPTGLSRDPAFIAKSVSLTLRRARYAVSFMGKTDTIIVAPIQGGLNKNLLVKCARKMKEMGYEMFAIGSPTGLMEKYRYKEVLQMILLVKNELGSSKPIHLFGAGHPMFFPFIVALGIDTFDSAAYSIYARSGRYLTRDRTYKLEELPYLPCNCDVCRRYDVKDLKELDLKQRISLLEKHNLYVSLEEIKQIKLHIKEGTLWNYLEEKARAHPSLYEAFVFMKKNLDFLIKENPFSKINLSGIFFYDPYSAIHPEVFSYVDNLIKNYRLDEGCIAIFLPFTKEKPFSRSQEAYLLKELILRNIKEKELVNRIYVFFTGYPFIIVPYELSETFPTSQWEGNLDHFPLRSIIDKVFSGLFFNVKLDKSIIFLDDEYNTLFKRLEKYINKSCNNILKIPIKKSLSYTIKENKQKVLDFILK